MALDICNYRQVVETTVKLSQKAGVSEIVGKIVNEQMSQNCTGRW